MINVLSLFDGISCAKLALNKANIKVDKYFSSEIDKNAIQVSTLNHPDIIQVGSVDRLKKDNLPEIDLLIGGSPCQDLSRTNHTGVGLKGKKSNLFFEYVRMLKEIKPKYFILENVDNKWKDEMSKYMGVDYIKINSNLFSGQSRVRLYWTNIPIDTLPPQSNIIIKDILETNVDERFFLKNYNEKDNTKQNNIVSPSGLCRLFDLPSYITTRETELRVYSTQGKSPTLLSTGGPPKILNGGRVRILTPLEFERLQTLPDNYTSGFSDKQRYKMVGNGFTVNVIAHLLKRINDLCV